jgi:hypothetical protein
MSGYKSNVRAATATPRGRLTLAAALLLATLVAAQCAAAAPASRPLQTAIVDPAVFTSPDAGAGLDRAVAAGASAIKVPLFWNSVAPAKRPRGFRASDPTEPAYAWSGLDQQLRLIRARGLEPLVYIAATPTWAFRTIDGARRPDPAQYRAFALAAARRYSGTRPGLPRVRYWQAWNEPNKVTGPPAKAGVEAWYRTLVNGFAASVHSIPGNFVVAGGVSPFGISTAVAPLTFMRRLLCVSPGATPHATCSKTVHFDVWSVDPYTAGGPFHSTARPDDISVAGLPTMRHVLDAATRLGHVVSATGHVRFWVTEFAWDTNPPDPGGVPLALEGRWVAEALHQMWLSGVSLVTWYTLRDQPLKTSPYQSGLYLAGPTFASDRPKPAFTAFRFPFVAYPAGKAISVWGRTPPGSSGSVDVEQLERSAWAVVARLRPNRFGIFSAKVSAHGRGPLRARLPVAGEASLPFSLVAPPDAVYQPFGAALSASAHSTPPVAAVSQYVETVPTASDASAAGSRLGDSRIALFGGLILVTTLVFLIAGRRTRGGLRPHRQ